MSLPSGTRLGPYEITGQVGAGGMGIVYRAKDTRLGRNVAIKVLPPGFGEDTERLRRFEQEARTVSGLNHPNIITVHDVGSHEGSPYLVMELLEGATLREKLDGSPLPPKRVLELGLELARGLTAAHEQGIVHRDLKPENVFITKDGRVKILDFGLAKLRPGTSAVPGLASGDHATEAIGSEGSLTEAGMVLGTVAYMSPEQACGKPLDGRSDIFSLGVILWEMLTGKRPFQRNSTVETLSAILKEDPPELGPELRITPLLERTLHSSLAKNPEMRFHSAHDLTFALQAASDTGSAAKIANGEVPVGAPDPAPSRLRPGWLLLVAGLRVLTLLGALLFWSPRLGRTPPYEPRCMAILPFENRTGDPALDNLGQQVVDLVRQDLQQVDNLKVAADIALAAGGDPTRKLAEATKARFVAAGAYYLRSGAIEFQARLVDPWSGKVVYTLGPWRGPREDPAKALSELRQALGGAAAWAYYDHDWQFEPGTTRPPRMDAFLVYRKAIMINLFFPACEKEFTRAMELDPDFLVARAMLFISLRHRQKFDDAQTQLGRMEEAYARLTPVEKVLVRMCRAMAEGRHLQVLKAIEELCGLQRETPWIRFWRGQYEANVNRTGSAIRDLKDLRADWAGVGSGLEGWPAATLCDTYNQAGDYQGELRAAREGLARFPDEIYFRSSEAEALASLGRIQELEAVFQAAWTVGRHQSTHPTGVMANALLELRAHGRKADAQRIGARLAAELRVGSPERIKRVRMELAVTLLHLDQDSEALAILQTLTAEDPANLEAKGCLGGLLARLGRVGEARKIEAELAGLTRPYLYGQHTFWRACIAAQLGEKDRAVELLREAFSQGYPFSLELHRELYLEPIRGYSHYETLVKPKD